MTDDAQPEKEVRPFRVLGLQQVALGARDKASFEPLWISCLGLPISGNYKSAAENVDETILTLGRGLGVVEIDLMQPLDTNKKPRVDQPALNHFGLWVDDLKAAFDWLSKRGVRFTEGGIRPGAAGHQVCFIHPKATPSSPIAGNGVLIELVQAPAEVIAAYDHATS